MISVLLLIVGFACLIKAADLLVDGSAGLAKRFNVSDLVIGLTVVAFGTSTPELFVNLTAAVRGNMDMAFSNVVGSNIANILLILGISALVHPLVASQGTVLKEIPFSLLAAVVLGICVNDLLLGGTVNVLARGDGLILLCFFCIFLYYSASLALDVQGLPAERQAKIASLTGQLIRILVGLGGLVLGGWLIVTSAVGIARSLGVSEALIGLTIVAVGTSLPELATSVTAAYKGNTDIAVGNVVGSNIFNIFFVLGVSALIHPIGYHSAGNLDLLLLVAASFLLFFSMFTVKKRSLDRWEAIVFLILYFGFIGYKVVTA